MNADALPNLDGPFPDKELIGKEDLAMEGSKHLWWFKEKYDWDD